MCVMALPLSRQVTKVLERVILLLCLSKAEAEAETKHHIVSEY